MKKKRNKVPLTPAEDQLLVNSSLREDHLHARRLKNMEKKIRKAEEEEERPQPQDRTPNISRTIINQNINSVHNVCQKINCNCAIGVDNNFTTTEQDTSNSSNNINNATVNNFIVPTNSSIGTNYDVMNSTNLDNDINGNIIENTQIGKNKIIQSMNCKAFRILIINTMVYQTFSPRLKTTIPILNPKLTH